MGQTAERTGTVPVGIDLGTTYSSLAYLTPQGQPVTLPNAEGELSTPSVVLFDGDDIVVGTEALRHAVTSPERVIQYAKRHMGDPKKCWVIDRRVYRPRDISTFILRKLLSDAEPHLGRIRHAVITVPAQFSELQRRDTVEAGLAAGLERVDIIHEPVAAALCYVLGEGLWFAELANEQTILVFDLGGGTFDLSLVKYNQHNVRVIASGGDLQLGGLDWNKVLENWICDRYVESSISDPRLDRECLQAIANEVELVKRGLSVRPKTTLVIHHQGRRTSFPIDRQLFEELTAPLLNRTEQITRQMLKDHKMGWAHVDTILATGGSSRMPMVRNMLHRLGGTTLNQSLSPDQSICHGAAYYAGMLLSGRRMENSTLERHATDRLSRMRQQSVSGRSLGILIRDDRTGQRRPHYLIAANTPLPCAFRQRFGTVIPNQRKVRLHIVESGTSTDSRWVELGECVIDSLPEGLPVNSPVEVTIRYDEQARVHIEAIVISSGQKAQVSLQLPTSPATKVIAPAEHSTGNREESMKPIDFPIPVRPVQPPVAEKVPAAPAPQAEPVPVRSFPGLNPIPIRCPQCGEKLLDNGTCPAGHRSQ